MAERGVVTRYKSAPARARRLSVLSRMNAPSPSSFRFLPPPSRPPGRRYRGTELHCEGCLRVTVGTPRENDAFLKLFKEVARAPPFSL